MTDNYAPIVTDNLQSLYRDYASNLSERARAMGASLEGERFSLAAFGHACRIRPDGIALDGAPAAGVRGILISLYALHARDIPPQVEPLKAFREFPHTMPYVGAFASHTEGILVPHTPAIEKRQSRIREALSGQAVPSAIGGDFAFLLWPLPKIGLCYIFYEADADFSASVTCLFTANAGAFMPIDGMADVGEYCSRAILALL